MTPPRHVAVFAILLFTAGLARAQEEPFPGAPELANALARQFNYLLPESRRAELDDVNRDLREAQDRVKKAAAPEDRAAAMSQREDACRRLRDLLPSCAGSIPVLITGARTVLSVQEQSLPAESGALLFEVSAGAGGPRGIVTELDLSEQSGPRFPIQVAPGVTTWVLAALSNVPALRTVIELEFQIADGPSTVLIAPLTTPDKGALDVTIVSDDTGRPVPAMVRLVRKLDNHEIRPDGAIEFAPQWDAQGNVSAFRRTNLPGRLGGTYWCVPGPFTMALSPGEYEVVVHRGLEHLPIFDTVAIESKKTTGREYRPRRWVDMPRRGWHSGDDHVHCQILSDGDADRLMKWVQAEDVHVANVVKMGDIHRTWFEQRGFGPAYRVSDGRHVLSPGQECPRTHRELGHTIHMDLLDMVRDTDRYYLYDTVFDAVRAQGGLSGYCHVNSGIFHVHRDMSMNIARGKVDFVEVLQFANLGVDLYYDFLNLGFKVTASAGSDVPWGGSVGEVRVYAYTGKRKLNVDDWFEAVRRGRTFVTNGIMLDLSVDGALPGDELRIADADARRPLPVRVRAWGHPERGVPAKLELIANGEPIKTAESDDRQQREIDLADEIQPGYGMWLAARAEGSDGSRAHTTPVYIVRDGFRFWKFEDVDALIAKRLASLDEIVQIVKEAVARNQRGEADDNRPVRQLALQGPELLERVEIARGIYEALRGIAEKERGLRGQSAGGA